MTHAGGLERAPLPAAGGTLAIRMTTYLVAIRRAFAARVGVAQVLERLREIPGVEIEGEVDGVVRIRADARGHEEATRALGEWCWVERAIRHLPQRGRRVRSPGGK